MLEGLGTLLISLARNSVFEVWVGFLLNINPDGCSLELDS